MSYEAVDVPPNSVIYCDPPYKGTEGYGVNKADGGQGFDHERFYDWCERQKELVIISEYDMPRERFACVWQKPHRSRLASVSNNTRVTERLYVPRHQENLYYERMGMPLIKE